MCICNNGENSKPPMHASLQYVTMVTRLQLLHHCNLFESVQRIFVNQLLASREVLRVKMDLLNCLDKHGDTSEIVNITPVYPSVYFADDKEKPSVTYYRSKSSTPNLARVVSTTLRTGGLRVETATEFVWRFFSKRLEMAREGWSSFGVQIGIQGQQIGVHDLVRFDVVEYGTEGPLGEEILEKDYPGMVFSILTIYRMGLVGKTAKQEYTARVLTRISDVAKSAPFSLAAMLPNYGSVYPTWCNDDAFCGLIASLDMYFIHFESSKWASVRVCTLQSRYRDCATVSTIDHLAGIFGKPLRECLLYVFSHRVAEEVKALIKGGEELGEASSYSPYLKDLQLSAKSPYSASVSPSLHTWVHFTGALTGSERSKNARMFSENQNRTLLEHAIWIAHYINVGGETGGYFFSNAADREEYRLAFYDQADLGGVQEAQNGIGGVPKKIDSPLALCILIKAQQGVPDAIYNMFAIIVSKFRDPRPGTVAAWLADNLLKREAD